MTPVALQPQIEAVSERPTVADLHAIGIAIAKSGVRNVRRHWIVNAIRSGVLLIVDVATLLALRFAWTLVADGQQAPPAGLSEEFLTGWSFPVALVMGLAIAGAYGSGEQRRSTGRVFAGVALAGLFALYPALWAGAAGVVGYQLTRTVILLGTALRVARWCADRLVDRFGPILGHRVIVVGSSDASGDPPVTSSRLRGARVKVVGWVGIPDEDGHDLESPAVRLAQMIHERQADTVIIRRPLQDADFTHVIDQALASGCLLLAGWLLCRDRSGLL